MTDTLAIVLIGTVAAGFVQGLSGFGFGLTAMSLWVWYLDPRLAATLAVFGALTGQLITAITVRRAFSSSVVLPFIAGGLVGVPIGTFILPTLDMVLFKTLLGAFLVFWCPAMLLAKRFPRIPSGGWGAEAGIGLAGGIMGGLGGFTGTVPTLWCTLRGYERSVQRAIIQNFNLSMLAMTMAVYVGTGVVTRELLPLFAAMAPAMLIPTLIGNRLYLGISDARFRQIVLGLLTLSGVSMLGSALPAYFA